MINGGAKGRVLVKGRPPRPGELVFSEPAAPVEAFTEAAVVGLLNAESPCVLDHAESVVLGDLPDCGVEG